MGELRPRCRGGYRQGGNGSAPLGRLFRVRTHGGRASTDGRPRQCRRHVRTVSSRRPACGEDSGVHATQEKVTAGPPRTRLIYDSLLEPLPGGVRARRPKWRQLLYEAGDYYIDLVFYQVPNTRLVRLLGQVTNRRDPTWFPGTRPILLKSGKTTVRRAASSEFQEFQMEYEPQPGLRLEVPIVGVREPIELALERPDTGGAEAITSDPVKQRSKKPRVKKPRRARKMSRRR